MGQVWYLIVSIPNLCRLSYFVDILQIRECIQKLPDNNNVIEVHWVPGHKAIKGDGLADKQAKQGVKEMVGADI